MDSIPLQQKFPVLADSTDRSIDAKSDTNCLDDRLPHQQDKLWHQRQQQSFVDRRALFPLIALVVLQTMSGTLYKVSQTESRYAYSTYAAFTLAEIGKLVVSMTLYAKERPKHQSLAQAIQATRVSLKKPGLVFKIGTLAALYFANNQLMFLLFLRADPASINLLKAGSGAITALVWCICMGRVVSQQQWIAIAIQACGLVVVQYDACKGQSCSLHDWNQIRLHEDLQSLRWFR